MTRKSLGYVAGDLWTTLAPVQGVPWNPVCLRQYVCWTSSWLPFTQHHTSSVSTDFAVIGQQGLDRLTQIVSRVLTVKINQPNYQETDFSWEYPEVSMRKDVSCVGHCASETHVHKFLVSVWFCLSAEGLISFFG